VDNPIAYPGGEDALGLAKACGDVNQPIFEILLGKFFLPAMRLLMFGKSHNKLL